MPRTIRTGGSQALDRELDALHKRIDQLTKDLAAAKSGTAQAVTQAVTQVVTQQGGGSGPTCCDEVTEARTSDIFGTFASLDARLDNIEALFSGSGGAFSYDFSASANSMYAALGVW